jgi:PAS domain S-box-containing protein
MSPVSDAGSRLVQELLDASPDALVVVGPDGVIELATQAVEPLLGYKPDELLGQPVEVLLPGSLRETHVQHRRSYSDGPDVRPMGRGLDLRAVRKDGTELPVDVSLVPRVLGERWQVGAFVRDATERRRNEDLHAYVNEISRNALSGHHTDDLLQLTTRRARTLTGASIAWVAVRNARADEVVVAAADGPGAGGLLGQTLPASTSLAARAMAGGQTLVIDDLSAEPAVLPAARRVGLGPGMYLPMLAEDGPVGALVLARGPAAPPFSPGETVAAEVFASAAAIVFALGSARESVEVLRMTSEHERIARDLHDTVIQRLFALGMRLQAAERLAQGPAAERIRETVDAIDEVIREIRETIFDLNRRDSSDPDLRQKFRQVTAEAAGHLGFTPRIAFRGPVEAATDEALTNQLLAVLREALANVGRHAQATTVDVVLTAADGNVTLSVADDGIGISDAPTAGHGTTNMASRAEGLGGEMILSRRHPSGTLLRWRVPTTR